MRHTILQKASKPIGDRPMNKASCSVLSRRSFLTTSAAVVGTGAVAQTENSTEIEDDIAQSITRNVSSFRALDWQPYFNNLNGGAILVDIQSRALHYWSADQAVFKLNPTPFMLQRNAESPAFFGPGPDNPLGTHALYLSWTYYRLHGTHDTRKIGRRSSNGCIGPYNEHISELFRMTNVGTQVLLI